MRSLLDEIFGSEDFISLITFKKTSSATSEFLPGIADHILWYAKNIDSLKFRKVYQAKSAGGAGGGQYTRIETPEGDRVSANNGSDGRPFRTDQLTSQRPPGDFPVAFGGKVFRPTPGYWKTHEDGMRRLAAARRLMAVGKTLTYVRYIDDFPVFPFTNVWDDTVTSGFADPKVFVVQTNAKVIERCMLMTTDPGDLVLDPTCGSGTTAYVAEQWGRRWITIDTSRVAVALARQRIMGSKLPYYLLADSPEGRAKEQQLTGQPQPTTPMSNDVRKGFVYERVPHVTLKSIANNPDIKEGMSREEINAAIARHAQTETLFDRPYEDRRKVRVSGPFTVESLSPHRAASFEVEQEQPGSEQAAEREVENGSFLQTILDNLLKAGIQNGWKNERLEFASLTSYPHQLIQAEGQRKGAEGGTPERIAVSIGPQYGTVSSDWIKDAAREALRGAGFDLLVVCGFSFDPHAVETVAEFRPSDAGDFARVQAERRLGRLPILIVRMNADLAMGEALLKKTGSGNLFTVFGEPDVAITETPDGLVAEIRGVDVYNPTTGEVRSSDTDEIAMWMLDTEYDEESFFVRHCYFTGDGIDPYKRLKTALKAEIDEAAWQTLYSTRSRPFPRPETGKVAVKVINHYGDEVLKVYQT